MIVFADPRKLLEAAARDGIAEAANNFAEILRFNGEKITVLQDGLTVVVAIEAAAAREFGTRTAPARPFAGFALQAHRQTLLNIMGRKIGEALARARRR